MTELEDFRKVVREEIRRDSIGARCPVRVLRSTAPREQPMTLEELTDSDEDTLWWGNVIDASGEEWEEHGRTLLWGNRSLAKEAGFYYALCNMIEGVRISTYPYSGERKKVGDMHCYGDSRIEDIYIGFDEDGEVLEHDANCLQYKDHLSVTFMEVDSDREL